MGGEKKYIEMFGSFTEPFNYQFMSVIRINWILLVLICGEMMSLDTRSCRSCHHWSFHFHLTTLGKLITHMCKQY